MKPAPDNKGGFLPDEDERDKLLTYVGQEALGAIPNSSRIIKRNGQKGDRTPDGSSGTILGSIGSPDKSGMFIDPFLILHIYIVRWDRDPDAMGVIIDSKIQLQ